MLIFFVLFSLLLFIQLVTSYPKELEGEATRFCNEQFDKPFDKKDYFWYLRKQTNYFTKSNLFFLSLYSLVAVLFYTITPSLNDFYFYTTISFILLVGATVDLKLQFLPDAMHPLLIIIGLLFSSSITNIDTTELILGMITGFLLTYFTLYITSIVLNKEAMGMGDVKLVSALGAIIGAYNIPPLLLLSSVLGGAFILFKKDKSQPFAFGPFLAISGIFILLLHAINFRFLDFYIY